MDATAQLADLDEPHDVAALSLDQLRRYRTLLREEEDRVSYLRRVLFGRADLLQKVLDNPRHQGQSWLLDARALAHALRDRHAGSRLALVRVGPATAHAALSDPEGWGRDPDLDDPADVRAVLEQTRSVADKVSRYRHQVHTRIDEVTSELIARYKADRSAVLRLLDEH